MSSAACMRPWSRLHFRTRPWPRNARRARLDESATTTNRVEFTNSLCVVTADQFPFLAGDFPELFAATERMIGYWFWELEHIP